MEGNQIFKMAKSKSAVTLGWLIASNVLKSLSQWLILVILIKYFTAEEVGYFTLGTAIAAPIFMLSEMQMKSVLVVEPDNGNDDFPTYKFIRLVATSLATLGLLIYCYYFRDMNWILISVIIYKAIESMVDILYGYLQKKDKMVWMSKSDIFKTLVTLVLCLAATVVLHKMAISVLSLAISSLAFYIINSCFTHRLLIQSHINKITKSKIIDVVKKSFPLGVSVLLGSYITNYPRIAIEGNCGPEMLAYYGAYSYLVIGVFQISAPIQTFLRQRLSTGFQKGDYHDFKSKVNYFVAAFIVFGILFMIGFLIFGDFVLKILYNEEYVSYSAVVPYLIIAQLLMAVSGIYSTAVLSFNVYTKQAILSFIMFVMVLLLSDVLIQHNGLNGAAFVNLLAALISVSAYLHIYLKEIQKWKK